MEYNIGLVLIEVSYTGLPSHNELMILGRSCADWVRGCLPGVPTRAVGFRSEQGIAELVRGHAKIDSEYTVVLYTDTPLITKRTVYDAVATLERNRLNVLRLTRGWVFRTDFLLGAEKVYTERVYYFEEEDFVTVFNYRQLAMARELMRSRILTHHLDNGVDIEDLQSTHIEPEVTIARGVTLAPGTRLCGRTAIAEGAVLGPNNTITDSLIAANTRITHSIIEKSHIGESTRVGPYAYLREGSIIAENCRIGDFVELKNARVGKNTKIAHLAYVGDAVIGENCNIGCGAVFANFNGRTKNQTTLGNNVFIGANANLIAPLTINDNALIAAGSTITQNVPPNALAIARIPQQTKPNWVK